MSELGSGNNLQTTLYIPKK